MPKQSRISFFLDEAEPETVLHILQNFNKLSNTSTLRSRWLCDVKRICEELLTKVPWMKSYPSGEVALLTSISDLDDNELFKCALPMIFSSKETCSGKPNARKTTVELSPNPVCSLTQAVPPWHTTNTIVHPASTKNLVGSIPLRLGAKRSII